MASPADPTSLHDLAVDAQTDIQKLATGLAHAGANPQAVQELSKMATVLAQIVKVLGQGPDLDQTVASQQQGAPQGGPPGQPAPAGPPQGGPPGAPPQGQPAPSPAAAHAANTIHSATQALHAEAQAAAQQRAQQPPR